MSDWRTPASVSPVVCTSMRMGCGYPVIRSVCRILGSAREPGGRPQPPSRSVSLAGPAHDERAVRAARRDLHAELVRVAHELLGLRLEVHLDLLDAVAADRVVRAAERPMLGRELHGAR